jgi:hypothetical protein
LLGAEARQADCRPDERNPETTSKRAQDYGEEEFAPGFVAVRTGAFIR